MNAINFAFEKNVFNELRIVHYQFLFSIKHALVYIKSFFAPKSKENFYLVELPIGIFKPPFALRCFTAFLSELHLISSRM